ncbi:MAG: DeoR/GlpR family DNA-binding transcription regulator [Ancrocorticia sp.]|uniref:DeoR/GlpR family DNA-binding transcription regulator n=1 Tax=Ancrocorticia sp. TaxID=2593684 RepID=UPI003F90EB4F
MPTEHLNSTENTPLNPRGIQPASSKRIPQARKVRLRKIVSLVIHEGVTTVDWLAANLGVSTMTVYRDVSELVDQGMLTRSYGEVSVPSSSLVETSSKLRLGQNTRLKDQIASAALTYVHPGDAVLLDDSTTSAHLLPGLRELAPVTVATNARFIEEGLISDPHISLIHLGGDYHNWADAYFGPMTVRNIQSLGIDICLMSVTAIAGGYCYHPDPAVAETKRAMVETAARSVLMVDHTKFTRTGLHKFASVQSFSAVITDAQTPQEELDKLAELGVDVVTIGE